MTKSIEKQVDLMNTTKTRLYQQVYSFFNSREAIKVAGRSPHFRRGEPKFICNIIDELENEWIKVRYRDAYGHYFYNNPIDATITLKIITVHNRVALNVIMVSEKNQLLNDTSTKYWITLIEELLRFIDKNISERQIIDLYGIDQYNELIYEDKKLENRLRLVMKIFAGIIILIIIIYLFSSI